MVAAFLSGSTNPPPPELVLPLQDLDRQMRRRRIDGDRAGGCAAGAGVSWPRKRAAITEPW